ncbi:cytochrome c [Thalassobius vesicularis]|uniref:Cytochrome c n=1 Tax=Thalassobius vesicularis TaxID=1294297 RepID=A0A4S3M7A1_9RHOB|nr:cytochrome c [Thalassobius vesicularis]THD73043.1 cytochrome c [Thalassobius vesicularis]
MPSSATLIAVAACALALPVWAEIAQPRAAELEHMVIQDCGSCHGLTMKGGLGSPLTREALDGADREVLATIILDGVPETAMPPWRPLITEEEALWIADYLLNREQTQ